ncbi:thiamine phosphate synthase [Garciella nitratireducens]|uniref:thiamine phosphate synthase n=1 Tax=Garciella nitratireducens TaxID=218205 RepID=UPI000DE9D548|nr:thiamine phosphate synthase [Garciella nitratireducens]RBP42687.1 thiamine-phosphate pyrophosphorylase [Garciella nitratireducens]
MLFYVTNRKLCKENFFHRMEELAKGRPEAILLREKDLSLKEYELLAIQAKKICDKYKVSLIINQNIITAKKLNLSSIHLSMHDFRKYKDEVLCFQQRGVSIHSLSEALEAQKLGASYLIAGHIYPTNCKKGIAPRGIKFLKEICHSVTIPVFAIGGIHKDKVKEIEKTGAKGICIMSEAMTCKNPSMLKNDFGI